MAEAEEQVGAPTYLESAGDSESEVRAGHLEVRSGMVGSAQTGDLTIMNGFVGVVAADGNASVSQAGAVILVAGQDMEVKGGGGTLIVAGQDMNIQGGGGTVIITGNNLNIRGGGAATMLAGNATLEKGFVGLLLSGNTEVREGGRVLLNTPQALAMGAALGVVFALLNRLLGKRR